VFGAVGICVLTAASIVAGPGVAAAGASHALHLPTSVAAPAEIQQTGTPASPSRSAAAPPRAQESTAPGAELTIYLVTMGQGDQVWEKFGHDAIGVRDAASGTDIVYNWGMFSFDQPGFLPRFLRGQMMYWMAPFDAAETIAAYVGANRSVVVQELDLTPAQRLSIKEFLEWNARDENKFYRYDYYRDNCSTRARDAIDRVLGGALKRQFEHVPTRSTYRDHSLRLVADDYAITLGVDIGLGRPTDRPISAWEEMFIPMKVRDRLRDVRVHDATGAERPLVRSERVVYQSTRTPERTAPPNRSPWMFLIGAAIATLLAIMSTRAARGLVWARNLTIAIATSWATLAGLLGIVLTLLWVATDHVSTYRNLNLLQFNPLWIVVAVLLPIGGTRAGSRMARTLRGLVILLAVISVAGFALQVIPNLRQGSGAPMALAAPVSLAIAFAVARLVPRHPRPR
jgi:hypothetical protein